MRKNKPQTSDPHAKALVVCDRFLQLVACGKTPKRLYDHSNCQFLQRYCLVFLRGRFTITEAERFCEDTFGSIEPPDAREYFDDLDMIVRTIALNLGHGTDQFPPPLQFIEKKYSTTSYMGILVRGQVRCCDYYQCHLCWHIVHNFLGKPTEKLGSESDCGENSFSWAGRNCPGSPTGRHLSA